MTENVFKNTSHIRNGMAQFITTSSKISRFLCHNQIQYSNELDYNHIILQLILKIIHINTEISITIQFHKS